MRWRDPTGEEWDSRYEYTIYAAYKASGKDIRRTEKGDTFSFTLPIRGGTCEACKSAKVGQRRTYRPDFFVSTSRDDPTAGYYIEAKGYLRAKQRSLLRNFYKANPDIDVRYILQRDFAATKRSSISQWFAKFLPNSKVSVWKGKPE